jgi:hypothetical protein
MATIDKNGRAGSAAPQNGHSTRRPAPSAYPGSRRPRAAASDATRFTQLRRAALGVPHRIEAQLKSEPVVTLAAVGAGCFVLGALLGSRLGRLALVTALPYAIERVFEGALGERIAEYAHGLVDEAKSVGDSAD